MAEQIDSIAAVNDEVIFTISAIQFTIDQLMENAITGFDVIRRGLTLKNTQNSADGVTPTDIDFEQTNADKLGGIEVSTSGQTDLHHLLH